LADSAHCRAPAGAPDALAKGHELRAGKVSADGKTPGARSGSAEKASRRSRSGPGLLRSAACQGFFWWEIDVSYYVLKGLEVFGAVWDVRRPPRRLLRGNRSRKKVRRRAGSQSTRLPARRHSAPDAVFHEVTCRRPGAPEGCRARHPGGSGAFLGKQ